MTPPVGVPPPGRPGHHVGRDHIRRRVIASDDHIYHLCGHL
jgi:hypothetical protein